MRKCKQQKRALRSVRVREIKKRTRARKKLQSSEERSAKSHASRINWLLNEIKKEKKE